SPSICTSALPEAARSPARATTPDPMTPSCTTLAGPRITSSIKIEFATLVCAPIRTFFPKLVEGRSTAFGPISQPGPSDKGPCRYAPERITQPSPIDTRPRIVTVGSMVPERTSLAAFRAVALSRRRSHGYRASTHVPSVRRARTGVRWARAETALDHVAPVQDEERALEVGPGLRHAVRRAELLLLRDVRDAGVERLSVLEVGLNPLAPITDDENQVPYPVLDQGLDDGLEERPVPDRDHDLRDRRGEGSHAGALSGGQDDG